MSHGGHYLVTPLPRTPASPGSSWSRRALGPDGSPAASGALPGWGRLLPLGPQALVALSAGSASDPRTTVDSLTLSPPSGRYRQSRGAGERCKYGERCGGGQLRGSAQTAARSSESSIGRRRGVGPALSLGGVPVPGRQVLGKSCFLTFNALGALVTPPPSPGSLTSGISAGGPLTLGVSASGDLNGTSQS